MSTSLVPSHTALCSDVKRTVLSNGLTIITKEVHTHPIVSQMLWYRVGSRNEELGQTGKSHFLEHMLFKGTDRYAKGEIDLITMKNGGRNNAFTWLDFTAYYFTFASDRWEIALDIEASRMRNNIFLPEEFASEKQVVIEELQIGQDSPWDALEEEVWATAFRQHPYRNPTVGWIEDLLNATVDDMKAYYDLWYHPRNATLVLVGDFDTNYALDRVESLFGGIPTGPQPKPLRIVEPAQRGEKRLVVERPTPVERLMIAYHAPSVSQPDTFPMQLLYMLLSSGRRSRLYQKLQEQDQSVTYARAGFNDHIDPCLFYIQAELKPGRKLQDVEESILSVLQDLATNPVSEAELNKAKRQVESNFILGNENILEQATLLGQFETIAQSSDLPESERGYLYLDSYLDHIRAVTPEDIQRVVKTYFGDRNRTVGWLVSDGSPASEEHEHRLHEGPVSRAPRIAFYRNLHRANPSRACPKPDLERTKLSNGMTLLTGVSRNIPAVSIYAVVNAGSRYEPEEKSGLASLLGEMLDEGTHNRSSQQLAEEIESVGGHLQCFGGYAQSGVSVTVLKPDFDLGLDLLTDVLINSNFPEDRLKQQLDRRLAQLKSREDDPRVIASDAFNEIIYRGHPAHRPKIGYEQTVRNLTREDLLSFYRDFFHPDNTMIAIVGDIDRSETIQKVERAFKGWQKRLGFQLPQIAEVKRQTAPIRQCIQKEKEQVNIFIGHLGIARNNPDFYSLLVLDTILGSSPGFTSRIPKRLRDEQGLAYNTYSNITSSAGVDPGRFVAYIGTSPENCDRAIEGILKELRLITTEPVAKSELQDAQDYLTGSFVFNFETNSQVASFLVEAELFGLGFDYLEKFPNLVRAVTVDDVFRVARQYLDPDNLTIVVVGTTL